MAAQLEAIARPLSISVQAPSAPPPIRQADRRRRRVSAPALAGPSARLAEAPEPLFLVCSSIVRWTTTLFRRCWRRSFEKVTSLDIEDARNPIQDIDTRSVNASLKRADVRAVDFSTMREFFLRDASRLPKLSQIERQYLSDIHVRERSGLKSISPRSIFDKERATRMLRGMAAFVKLGCELRRIGLKWGYRCMGTGAAASPLEGVTCRHPRLIPMLRTWHRMIPC